MTPSRGSLARFRTSNSGSKLKYNKNISSLTSLPEFIDVWNQKIDMLKNINYVNKKFDNILSSWNDNILINLLHWNDITIDSNKIKHFYINDIENKLLKDVRNVFIYNNLLISSTKNRLYYKNIKDLYNSNYTWTIIDVEDELYIDLSSYENNLEILDIMFESSYFIIISKKSQIRINYFDEKLEIGENIIQLKRTKYLTGNYKICNKNIINYYNNILMIGYENMLDSDNYNKWIIKNLNQNTLFKPNPFNTSREIFNSYIDPNKMFMFYIDKYQANEISYYYIERIDSKMMLNQVSMITNLDTNYIDYNHNIFDITREFEKYIQIRLDVNPSDSLLVKRGNKLIYYFIQSNILWYAELNGDDTIIKDLIYLDSGIEYSTTNFIFIDNLVIFSTNIGNYIIDNDSYVLIRNNNEYKNSLNCFIKNIDTKLDIIPTTPVKLNNVPFYLITFTDRYLYLYLINDEIVFYNSLLDENYNLIGFYDRINNIIFIEE